MNVKILGSGCPSCRSMYNDVSRVIASNAGKIEGEYAQDNLGVPLAEATPTALLLNGVSLLFATIVVAFDPAAQSRHASMAAAIADCQVLLARGMGAGAYESMRQANI